MKRMILAASLIAAVCVVSVSGYLMMNKKTAALLYLIDEAAAASESGDFKKMKEYAEKIGAEWDKSRTLISKTARHGNMDELSIIFADMSAAAESENSEEYKNPARKAARFWSI